MPGNNAVREDSPIDMRKGKRVVLKNGAAKKFPNYISAFIDRARKTTNTLQPVIVLTRDGSYRTYRPKKKNVQDYVPNPTTRVSAAFQQHAHLDELVNSLAHYLALCGIERGDDNGEVMNRIAVALDRANDEYKNNPTLPMRRVNFTPEPTASNN